ncbi:unnamed protein product, partial [Linum tenue]
IRTPNHTLLLPRSQSAAALLSSPAEERRWGGYVLEGFPRSGRRNGDNDNGGSMTMVWIPGGGCSGAFERRL